MKELKHLRIMFIGGHSTPAFAVIDEILLRYNAFDKNSNYHSRINLLWIGEKYNQRGSKEPSAEYKTVTQKYKIKFINLKTGKLQRHFSLSAIKEIVYLLNGFTKSFFIILKNNPDIIVSFGGFTAVPVVIWGRIFNTKVITHEQTITTGLANKIIAKFANKILISWEESAKFFQEKKVVFTGNPIRKDVFEIKSNITSKFSKDLPILYITGGNQGAHEINWRVFEIIEKLINHFNVIHQTGSSTITKDFDKGISISNKLMKTQSQKFQNKVGSYIVKDYVTSDEIGEVMGKSDIIVSRSGANTVSEVLALGKMCILIPIPWSSNNEQLKNAKFVESTGLGKVLEQKKSLKPEGLLKELIKAKTQINENKDFNNNPLDKTIEKAKSKINLESPKIILNEIIDLVE